MESASHVTSRRRSKTANAGKLRVDDVRSHFARLGATIRVTAFFEGALLDRLIDAEHADVIEAGVRELRSMRWPVVQTEVSFNEWGERGSIDLLAADEQSSSVVIGEAKSAWGSVEETLRALDVKTRLAPKVVYDRFGWRPTTTGVVLVFPETGSTRRVAQRHSETLLSAYPVRNREIRSWLRQPSGPLRGLWFLSIGRHSVQPHRPGTPNRVNSVGFTPNRTRQRATGRK